MSDAKYLLSIDVSDTVDDRLGEILNDILLELNTLVRASRRHYREDQRTAVPIDLSALLAKSRRIALIWTIEDVVALRPDLTDEQAWSVLEHARDIYTPEVGLSSRVLEGYANQLFGPRPAASPALTDAIECITYGPDTKVSFPYQCYLRDGRCVLVHWDINEHVVLATADVPMPRSPRVLPPDMIPAGLYAILERVIAEGPPQPC